MPSRILFSLLALASLWSFSRTLYRRFHHRIQSTPPLRYDRLGERLWRAFAEVMLQTRVIRDRPLVGILHALVMWGFLVFAWVSVEHMALGIRGLDRAAPERTWYSTFAAVWAVAVLAGILGLAFRRFVLRPRVLGPLSGTSALVSAFIVALMVTHLLGWGAFEPGSEAWKANWWAHTLSFFAILTVIPTSKHLHLLLGPIAIFFRSSNTSSVRALRAGDDDDLGMVRFTDLAPKDLLDLHACVDCRRCTQAGPANNVGQSLNPKEVILQMQRGLMAETRVHSGSPGQPDSGHGLAVGGSKRPDSAPPPAVIAGTAEEVRSGD